MTDPVRGRPAGVEIAIRVQPGARRTEPAGVHGDEVKIRVAAPPVDGRANVALVRFLAKRLSVPPSQVQIVAGAASRSKRVVIDGATPAAVRSALGLV